MKTAALAPVGRPTALGLFVGGLAAAGLLVLSPNRLQPFVVGTIMLGALGIVSLARPHILIYFVIITASVSGLLRSFDAIGIGTAAVSLSGLRWVVMAGIAVFVVGMNVHRAHVPAAFVPFIALPAWAVVRGAYGGTGTVGAKDVLFYGLPFVVGMYTVFVATTGPALWRVRRLEVVLLLTGVVPAFLYTVLIPFGLVYWTENGPIGIVGPRPVATFLLIVAVLALAVWRYGSTPESRRLGRVVFFVSFGTILFTLSRLATATAVLVACLARFDRMRLSQILIGGLLAVALGVGAVLTVPILRDRMFHRPPESVVDAVRVLDLRGRDAMWRVTAAQIIQKPIIGWSAGSSRLLVGRLFAEQGGGKVRGAEVPPHNEYLQVLHDLGVIGLVLMLGAWGPFLIHQWTAWRNAHSRGDRELAKWHMATTLGIIVVLANSTADNTLHYPQVVAPLFVIAGCAEALRMRMGAATPGFAQDA